MITEDYIGFETSRLMKEKGFDEYCYGYYYTSEYMTLGDFKQKNLELFPDSYSAPTLQMAMKWLREVHGKFISVEPGAIFGRFDIYVYYDNYTKFKIIERNKDNYEEACEEGIRYVLENMI